MICRIFRSVVLTMLLGLPSFSFAYSECEPGNICYIFKEILDKKGGPLAGALTSSGGSQSNMQFNQKKACELAGAHCSEAKRLGCERVQSSVLPGIVECWNGKSFRLYDKVKGENLTYRSYVSVANLVPNNTDRKLVLTKGISGIGSTLLNENGQILADGEALGCDTFVAAGEDTVACMRGNKKYLLKVSDLERSAQASIKVNDFADDISVNLCGVALAQIDKGKSDSYVYDMKSFKGLSGAPIDIYKKSTSLGSSCVMYPEKKNCTAIYINKQGLECYSFGSLVYKKSMSITQADLVKAAKTYVFRNKEIVKMTDVYGAAQESPAAIRIDKPDSLIGSTKFIQSASGGSGTFRGAR